MSSSKQNELNQNIFSMPYSKYLGQHAKANNHTHMNANATANTIANAMAGNNPPMIAKEIKDKNLNDMTVKTLDSVANELKTLMTGTDINNSSNNFHKIIEEFVQISNAFDPFIMSNSGKYAYTADPNEDRIRKFNLFNTIFTSMKVNMPLSQQSFHAVVIDRKQDEYDNIIPFYFQITQQVLKKQLLNFSMCIYSNTSLPYNILNKQKRDTITLYFFKHKPMINKTIFSSLKNDVNDILFQKILIFQTLQKYGLASSNYMFEEISLFEKKVYHFRINGMVFSVPLTKIIILSPLTVLTSIKNLSAYSYLNSLDKTELNFLNIREGQSFYEIFFNNFKSLFNTSILNAKRLNTITTFAKPINSRFVNEGKLYILKKDNEHVYCVVMNKTNTHVSLVICFDSSIKGTLSTKNQIMSFDDLDDKIYDPELDFDNITLQGIYIG